MSDLKPNQIFVFGSNTQGRHGKGAALVAKEKYGAIYGMARGPQGKSYAIVTKELRKDHPPVTLTSIKAEVDDFIRFAQDNPEMEFYVTAIGTNLAGFKVEEIAPMFDRPGFPNNIRLCPEFTQYIKFVLNGP